MTLPLATTKEFRTAVKHVLGHVHMGHSYTDNPNKTDIRYVSWMYRRIVTTVDCQNIEMVLFLNKVTANTRVSKRGYLKGTCVIS